MSFLCSLMKLSAIPFFCEVRKGYPEHTCSHSALEKDYVKIQNLTIEVFKIDSWLLPLLSTTCKGFIYLPDFLSEDWYFCFLFLSYLFLSYTQLFCDPRDCSLLCSAVHGVSQARILIAVQSLSHVWLFVSPWIAACPASLPFTTAWILLKFMSIESVISSNQHALCRPLLLLPSIFPSIRVFSNESVLCIR